MQGFNKGFKPKSKRVEGKIRGPGTGTSDDIKAQVPEGSYIMPADSTQAIGEQNLAGMGAPVDVNVSNGEFVLPPEQVHAVGVQALNQMRDQTHTPTGKPQVQGSAERPDLFFADGGPVEDPRRRPIYVDSRGTATNFIPSQSRELIPSTAPGDRVYVDSRGYASPGQQFSPSREIVPVNPQHQQIGPANSPSRALVPTPQPTPQPSGTDFYTNTRGETARGFMPSSSRAVTPAGPLVSHNPPSRSVVPAGPLINHQHPEGIDQATRDRIQRLVKADTANWQQYQASQDARFSGGQPPDASGSGAGRGFWRGAMRVTGPLATVASAVPEARDVANVAGDERATKLDVATQAAEGVARVAGTGAGAAWGFKTGAGIGALGGPISWLTVPAGALIGAGIGGWLGSKATDGAIELGRRATGQDTASPAERLSGNTPSSTPVIDQDDAAPAQPEQLPAGQPPISQPAAVQGGANNVIREGNSYYADGPITAGFTINGQNPATMVNIVRSPQNEQAVQALLARTPEFGAGTAAVRDRGFQPVGSRVAVVGDRGRQESERRRAFAAASTPHPGAQNRQLTAAQINAMRGLISDELTADNQRYATDAGLTREEMSQAGADRRAASRDAIDLRRVIGEEESRGFKNRAAARVERLYEQYEQASTPEEKSAIAEQLRILSGNSQAPRFAVAPGGQIVDPTTYQLITQPAQIFNTQTGEIVRQQAALPPLAENPAVQQILQDTSISKEERARRIRALGYQ